VTGRMLHYYNTKKSPCQYFLDAIESPPFFGKRKQVITLSSIGGVCSTMAETLFTLVPCSRLSRILRSQVSYSHLTLGMGGSKSSR